MSRIASSPPAPPLADRPLSVLPVAPNKSALACRRSVGVARHSIPAPTSPRSIPSTLPGTDLAASVDQQRQPRRRTPRRRRSGTGGGDGTGGDAGTDCARAPIDAPSAHSKASVENDCRRIGRGDYANLSRERACALTSACEFPT